jgi:hypothetical protein
MEDSPADTTQQQPPNPNPVPGTLNAGGNQAGGSQTGAGQFVTVEVLDRKISELFDKVAATINAASSSSAQGTVDALDRIEDVKRLVSTGPVGFSQAQMAALPSAITVGMEGVPVLVPQEVPAFRELQAAGLTMGQSGGSASLRHELPVLLTRLAVGGLLRDVMDTLYEHKTTLSPAALWRIVGPGGPVDYLQKWLMELDSARYESIRTYVFDGALFAATYECLRFAPYYSGGNDVAKEKLRSKHADAMGAALDKSIKQATKDAVANKTVPANIHPPKPANKGTPGPAGRGKGKHHTATPGAGGDAE